MENWITEEGTPLFRPIFGPIEVPALKDPLKDDYHELVPLYEEGLLSKYPQPWGMSHGPQCSGCESGEPHPATKVMVFDAGNRAEEGRSHSFGDLIYRLSKELGWEDCRAFERAISLRASQFLWLVRHMDSFFRESIHPIEMMKVQAGMHCLFFINDGTDTAAYGLFHTIREGEEIPYKHISIQYLGKELPMVGSGLYGENSCRMVLPLSPSVCEHS
jgi:hypothetical protein